MPISLPDIPEIDEKTPYPAFKKMVSKMRDAVLRGWLLDGENTAVVNAVGANGRMVNASAAGSAGAIDTICFRLADASADSDLLIRVYRGTITSPDGTFVPSGFGAGDTPPYTLDVTAETTGVVFVFVTVDDTTGEVLTAENPDFDTTIPANTATEFYIELGSFDVTDDILTVQSNNLGCLYFELCGGVAPVWGGFNDA